MCVLSFVENEMRPGIVDPATIKSFLLAARQFLSICKYPLRLYADKAPIVVPELGSVFFVWVSFGHFQMYYSWKEQTEKLKIHGAQNSQHTFRFPYNLYTMSAYSEIRIKEAV